VRPLTSPLAPPARCAPLLQAYCPLAQATKLSDPQLVAIAERVGKTPAQVCLLSVRLCAQRQ
jgi:hypothetical protein